MMDMRGCGGIVQKTVILSPKYIDKIRRIKQKLGVTSDSEIIRRALDNYAREVGVLE